MFHVFCQEQQLPSCYQKLAYVMFKEFNELKVHMDNLNKVRLVVESAFTTLYAKELLDGQGKLCHKNLAKEVQRRSAAMSYGAMTELFYFILYFILFYFLFYF